VESEREAARRAIKRRNWLAHLWREWIVESRRPIAPVFARPTPDTWSNENLTAAWIGHSTVLINFFGVTILTDPVLFPRIGIRLPFLTIGPKRLTEPALTFAELPPIDLVLLSHAHFDHIDRRTLKLFPESTRVITASRTRDLLRGTKFSRALFSCEDLVPFRRDYFLEPVHKPILERLARRYPFSANDAIFMPVVTVYRRRRFYSSFASGRHRPPL